MFFYEIAFVNKLTEQGSASGSPETPWLTSPKLLQSSRCSVKRHSMLKLNLASTPSPATSDLELVLAHNPVDKNSTVYAPDPFQG